MVFIILHNILKDKRNYREVKAKAHDQKVNNSE